MKARQQLASVLEGREYPNSGVQVEDYGDCIVVNNLPEAIDAYGLLDFCDNVEREGEGSFRFDGVYPDTKRQLIRILRGEIPPPQQEGRSRGTPPATRNH